MSGEPNGEERETDYPRDVPPGAAEGERDLLVRLSFDSLPTSLQLAVRVVIEYIKRDGFETAEITLVDGDHKLTLS